MPATNGLPYRSSRFLVITAEDRGSHRTVNGPRCPSATERFLPPRQFFAAPRSVSSDLLVAFMESSTGQGDGTVRPPVVGEKIFQLFRSPTFTSERGAIIVTNAFELCAVAKVIPQLFNDWIFTSFITSDRRVRSSDPSFPSSSVLPRPERVVPCVEIRFLAVRGQTLSAFDSFQFSS